MHDLDDILVGIEEIGAAALERARAAVLLLEYVDAFRLEECLRPVVLRFGQAEGAVDFMLALRIGIDRLLGEGEHEIVLARRTHEHHVAGAADFLHAEDLGVKFLRAVEVLDRDGEVKDTFGSYHWISCSLENAPQVVSALTASKSCAAAARYGPGSWYRPAPAGPAIRRPSVANSRPCRACWPRR